MGRHDPDHDFDDDDFDNEAWDGDDPDDDDDPTIPCPRCSEPIFDDAERCTSCGEYLSREESGPRKPWWLVLGVAVCLGMTAWWAIFFF